MNMSELNEVSQKKKTIEELVAEHKRKTPMYYCPDPEQARENTRWFLDHASIRLTYDDLMMFITVYVLFGDDLKILAFDKQADDAFMVLTSLSFILFLIEMLLNIWAKSEVIEPRPGKSSPLPFAINGYFLGFFFWLDLLAVLSMIFDLPWLQTVFGLREAMRELLSSSKAGAAGKVGAKAGRVVRMVRLVRLVKLYKIASQRRREKKMLEDIEHLVDQGRIDEEEIDRYYKKMQSQTQSKVGSELSDSITRRVITIVLLLLVTVPFLTNEDMSPSYSSATSYMQRVTENYQTKLTADPDSLDCFDITRATKSFLLIDPLKIRMSPNPLLGNCSDYAIEDGTSSGSVFTLEKMVNDGISHTSTDDELSVIFKDEWHTLRNPEIGEDVITSEVFMAKSTSDIAVFEAHFSDYDAAQETASSSVLLTLFVIVILIGMASSFQNVTQELVLAPIEQMMEMVRYVAEDPLDDFEFEDRLGSGQYETKVIQIAIQKITSLLRVGFGVAGAEIISMNMRMDAGGSSGLDPMIPGKRMYAIFGFCDIHEFDMCTEKLKDEIMTFVNSVARIVHEEVTRWGGSCNKNLGNAFLMIWRIADESDLISKGQGVGSRITSIAKKVGESPDHETESRMRSRSIAANKVLANVSSSEEMKAAAKNTLSTVVSPSKTGKNTPNVNLKRVPHLDVMSDKALIGFLKVIVEINRDPSVLAYRRDKRLQHGEENFLLRMGFGLHAGWAIEGAVGSLQKVDATYLSPHVNMAARMEAASRQFGVAVLMTEKFQELLSDEARLHCRRLDIVTVKGSAQPMPIYTYDTFQNQTFPILEVPKGTDLTLSKVLQRKADQYTVDDWKNDEDLVQLRTLATKEFRDNFNLGISMYLAGDWPKAKEILEKCTEHMKDSDFGTDGPSRTILNYMRNRNWECPDEWEGFRPLTSK